MFVVYLTMYKGDKLPRWYIGSSSEDKILDGYNGSVCSKKYKDDYLDEQRINKHLFKTRILSFHEDRKEALAEELIVQKLHNVVKNEKYMNMSYAVINGFFGMPMKGVNIGEKNVLFGKKRSPESIAKQIKNISGEKNVLFGKHLDEKVKNKISETVKETYKNNPYLGENISKRVKEHYKNLTCEEKIIYAKVRGEGNKRAWEKLPEEEKIRRISLLAGDGNPNAKKIIICDNFDNIVFKCHGNFDKVLKENNMPVNPFKLSKKLNGERIKENKRQKNIDKFIGWYAKDE